MKAVVNVKKILQNRIAKNYLLLFLSLFLIEIIFKVVLEMPILDWSILRIFVGINIISMVLSVLFSFVGRIGSNILSFIAVVIASLYAVLQAGFYNYLGVFISLGTSSQLGAVTEYIKDYFDSFKGSFYLIFIPLLILFLYYVLLERKVKIIEINEKVNFTEKFNTPDLKKSEEDRLKKNKLHILKNTRINYIIILLVLIGIYYYSLSASFMQNELQLRTTKELFEYPDLPNLAVNQFGIETFGLLDIEITMFPKKQSSDDEFLPYVKPSDENVEITDYTRLINDEAWEKWANETTNIDYKKLNNYFMSRKIADKNDYTGLFKDKNLVVIMMESVNTILLDENYFPNITKLANEGWNFENAFSPRNACSTGNNEMSGMVSLYTVNRTCTANIYKNNQYPNAIFNLFNNAGYNTNSFHNYTDQYYYRKTIHPNMGSNKFYGATDLGIPYSNIYEEWPSDVELVEKALEKTQMNQKFMMWLTTVSSHQPYTVKSELGDLNLDLFKDTKYPISLKRYLSKLKVLDDAIGTLVANLEKEGILDDTVIVLYADHYPYGLSNQVLNQYFDYNVNTNNEVDRTPFIIYNPSLTATTYKQYTSYMNIVPTLANLFDLEYDPRLYAGYDLLSADYPDRVVFADGSWQDSKAFYNATTGKISYYGDEKYDNDYVITVNKEINTLIKMSNTAITSNYFNARYEGMKKYIIEDDDEPFMNVPNDINQDNKEEEKKEE